jgi:hypothetical protein
MALSTFSNAVKKSQQGATGGLVVLVPSDKGDEKKNRGKKGGVQAYNGAADPKMEILG